MDADISPNEQLFESLLARIADKVPEIRFIDQDLGQLENYDMRPAVSWPCLFIDIEETRFSDAAGNFMQIGEGMVTFRLGLVKYSNSNNITPANVRKNALFYYRLENKLYKALHGWAPDGFTRLLRRAEATERRDDDIRVRISKYAISFEDSTAAPVKTKIPIPGYTELR